MALPNPRFEASYERLLGQDVAVRGSAADTFFERFYSRFLSSPDVAQLFADTDMRRQIQMLKRSLFQLVGFYVSGQPSAELQRIADLHVRLNVPAAMFDDWLAALVDTVEELDPEADEVTRLAWCWALAPGITYMQLALNRSAES